MDNQYSAPPYGTYYPGPYSPMLPPSDPFKSQPRLHQMQTLSTESLGNYPDYDEPTRSMAMPPPPGKRRRQVQTAEGVKHRRTRSGCYTCRQRRVKCDETHPICERCRKGKRECTYPGEGNPPPPGGNRSKPGGTNPIVEHDSSSSSSGNEAEEREPLSAIPHVDEEEEMDEKWASDPRNPEDTSSSLPPRRSPPPSTDTSRRPQPTRTNSRPPTHSTILQDPRYASLPKDVKFYLKFHREHMSHHHYAFKYDGGDFLKTTFLEIAMNDGSAALLYSIVAFAAYHYSIAKNDSNIATFLSYYNKSITFLQQSLKRHRHSVSTLLTILQLATIEEFLGDWINLMGHQKAAYQILTDLFTPQTIMQDETRRKIITWYIRFDLFAGMMGGGATTLERDWFAASAEFYQRQTRDKPHDLGARFEGYFATSRLLATDVTILFSGKAKNSITDEQFATGLDQLAQQFHSFGHTIETAFTDPSCFVHTFPDPSPDEEEEDLFQYRDPHFLYAGELSTMNFVLTDHWAIDMMFKLQISIALGQPPPVELGEIAMKKCKMFDAIQHGSDGGATAILGCQASLGIMSLFLPKDPRYTLWSRQKFARIEQLGYIYPSNLRKRMSDHWGPGIDVTDWWLPDRAEYPPTLRTVRDFVLFRATRPHDAWTSGISNMSGVFRDLKLDEDEEDEEGGEEGFEEEEEEEDAEGRRGLGREGKGMMVVDGDDVVVDSNAADLELELELRRASPGGRLS